MPTLTLLDDAMLRAGRMVPAVHRLGGGSIAMAGTQQPWRVVGSEAVVYQLRQPTGRVLALRCLLSDTHEASFADRYRALSDPATLRNLRAGGTSPIVGQIAFLPEGLSLPGSELRSVHHPIVAMDWVMGPTLIAAADRACRARDEPYLTALAQAWLSAMEILKEIQFVHGNLTGDNAMVRPREGIALVDYDTAFWPGAPTIKHLEPRPGYRHPKGVSQLAERRDDFAALVIYTSLRILSHWPDLREVHGDPASQLGGTLLFSARDLMNPAGSALFGKIRVLDDPEVQALIASLREACRKRPDDCPPFLDVVRGAATAIRHFPSSTPPPRPIGMHDNAITRQQNLSRLHGFLLAGDEDGAFHFWRTSGLIDDPQAIRDMGARIAEIEHRRAIRASRTAAEQADYVELIKQWESGKLDEEPSAAALRPIVARVRRRSDAIDRLRSALESGDAAVVGSVWPRVQTDPAASVFAARANEVISKLMGAAIAGAIERGDDASVVRAVEEAEAQGFAIGMAARRAARAAEARLDAQRRVETALASDDRAMLADMALAGELDEMGEFDAQTTKLIMRALATAHLLRAVALDEDFAIYNAYEPEIFGGSAGVPEEHAERVNMAVSRVRWLRTVRSALKQRDVTTLRTAMSAIPGQADSRLSKTEVARIQRLMRQEDALAALDAAISQGGDNRIIDALNEVELSGAVLPPDLNWDAIRGVIDRLSLIATIRRTMSTDVIDYQRLARLLAQARDEMSEDVPYLGTHLDFVQLERDVWRAAHRSRVREALKTGDDKKIAGAALPDLYGAISTLEPVERDRVQRAIDKHRNVDPLAPKEAVTTH